METTRFWASRTQVEHDGHAHIRQVIGPDEYHETVDDNAYTNTMAVFNLERAADAADVLKREHWGDRQPLSARLDLKEREPQSWRALAAALVTGFNVATEMAFKSPTSGTRYQHRPHQSAHNRDGISSWSRSVQTCVEALSRNQGRDEVIGPRLVDS